MQRIVAMSAYYGHKMKIKNPCFSEDCLAAIEVAKSMGVGVDIQDDIVTIQPGLNVGKPTWRVGESGLASRIFGVIAAMSDTNIRIEGSGSLNFRPMKALLDIFTQMEVQVINNGPFLPFEISGPPKNQDLVYDGSEGSQVLTGLLIALPKMNKDSSILIKNLKSRPYIDVSISLLEKFGIILKYDGKDKILIPGGQSLEGNIYENEGDWSGASFFAVASEKKSTIGIKTLQWDSLQGDRTILNVLRSCGVKISKKDQFIDFKADELRAFEFDATDTPDLFPPLVALAASCKGKSTIHGVSRLIHKESNRLESLLSEFSKLGILIQHEGTKLLVHGGEIHEAEVHSHGDHRIAMALAIAASKARGPVIIDQFESVNKSYPLFLKHFSQLGGIYNILEE